MSHVTLKQLIGAALVDREFCDGLMNGKRATILAGLDLTGEERALVASWCAVSVQELAVSVYNWVQDGEMSTPTGTGYPAPRSR